MLQCSRSLFIGDPKDRLIKNYTLPCRQELTKTLLTNSSIYIFLFSRQTHRSALSIQPDFVFIQTLLIMTLPHLSDSYPDQLTILNRTYDTLHTFAPIYFKFPHIAWIEMEIQAYLFATISIYPTSKMLMSTCPKYIA